jgi:hypothetical protein
METSADPAPNNYLADMLQQLVHQNRDQGLSLQQNVKVH